MSKKKLNELTEGYMLPEELPSFKIYDASEKLYYNAIPSQEFELQDGNIDNTFQAYSLYYSNEWDDSGTDKPQRNFMKKRLNIMKTLQYLAV